MATESGLPVGERPAPTHQGTVDVPVAVVYERRPALTFAPLDAEWGVFWLISRRMVDGRYRWSARLRVDGERRTSGNGRQTRGELLAEWRAEREQARG